MTMNWKDSYGDICAELRIAQIHEMEMRRRVEIAHDVVFTGEMPSSGSYCHLPLDKGITYFNNAVDALEKAQAEVDRLNDVKAQMEQHMAKFTGLAHVIQYKQMVEGKTYRQIGADLGYSEKHLRNVMWNERDKHRTQSTNVS